MGLRYKRTIKVLAAFVIALSCLPAACAPVPPVAQNAPPAPVTSAPAASPPAAPATTPAPPAAATPVMAAGPAAFTISNLSIYPQFPAPLAYAMVIVDVTNTGGDQGTYMVDVKVDGKTVTTQNVTLDGGTTQTVRTGFDVGKVGIYTVSVGDLSLKMDIFAKMFSDQ